MGAPHIAQSGKYIKALACGAARGTAAGAGDNTAITGATIDRQGYGSCKFVIAYKTTLTAAATLQFAVAYQESSDGSNWDTAVTVQAATTASTGAQTALVGEVSFNLDLEGVGTPSATQTGGKRYIRFNMTPDLSAGSADLFDVAGVCILGGADLLPAV